MFRRHANPLLPVLLLLPLLLGGVLLKTCLIIPSYKALEKNEAVKDIQRCLDALDRERQHLEIFNKDWSLWDDTYKFVQDRNEDYIKSNLDWTVVEGKLKVNLLFICDKTGKVVWGEIYDSTAGGKLTLKDFSGTRLAPDHWALRHVTPERDFSGYVVTEHGLMLLVASSILPTSAKGPAMGTMIVGQFVNEALVKSLNEQTQIHFTLKSIPMARRKVIPPARDDSYRITEINNHCLTITGSLSDLLHAYRIDVTARIPRVIYEQGLTVANYVMLATVLIYLVTGSLVLLLTHNLRRFTQLRKRDQILAALAGSAGALMREDDLNGPLASVLRQIGDATRVCRIRILENRIATDGRLLATLRAGWENEENCPGRSGSQLSREYDYQADGFDRWVTELSLGNAIFGNIKDFPPAEYQLLKAQAIRSIAIIPIFSQDRWWGLIGFEDCRASREWTDNELDALRLAASMIGGAIQRQQVDAELSLAKEEAEQASRSKGEFLANMSHEIRTPMSGVIGMIDLLLNTPLETRQQKYAVNIKNSADALLAVINDVLDFSKIEAGQLSLEEIDFDLGELVSGVMDLMAVKANEKGLELLCQLADDVPQYVAGDPNRLRQVLTNLLGNAVKFTASGEVSLRVRLEGQAGDEVRLHFSVRDTGIGLAPALQAKIFDAFAQADSSVSRRYGGTGLGLSISSRLAQLMGGEIGVQSQEGQGSTFWFTAVLKKRLMPTPKVLPVSITGKHVIVVDDNQTHREILLNLLGRWGCRADEAPDGFTALQMIRAVRDTGAAYDLAILDHFMPEMDGEQLAERIRQDAGLDSLRLLMLTSINGNESTGYYTRKRIDARLTKPVKPTELLLTLEWVLGRRVLACPGAPVAGVSPAAGVPGQDEIKGHKYRLLLAEDNEINQDYVLSVLSGVGLTAEVAGDGEQAVAAFEKTPDFDLILMDCQMPRLSGYDATIRIRALEAPGWRVPIIAVTANAMKGDRERCLAAGMDDYLTKPLNPNLLLDRIFHWLAVARERQSDPQSVAQKTRVLLTEDDAVLQELGQEILSGAGFHVDLASHGQQAVELARAADYDVILMDNHMPGMDGFEATRLIRTSAGRNARVPIIAVTGSISEMLLRQMNDGGMNDYLLKPYVISELVEKINHWAAEHRKNNQPTAPQGPGGQGQAKPGMCGSAATTFDYQALLERCMGKDDLAHRLLNKFNEQIDGDLAVLRQGLAAGDAPAVVHAAHKIKGAAANLTLEAVRQGVALLEKQARAGLLDDGAPLLAEVEQAVAAARNEIDRLYAKA